MKLTYPQHLTLSVPGQPQSEWMNEALYLARLVKYREFLIGAKDWFTITDVQFGQYCDSIGKGFVERLRELREAGGAFEHTALRLLMPAELLSQPCIAGLYTLPNTPSELYTWQQWAEHDPNYAPIAIWNHTDGVNKMVALNNSQHWITPEEMDLVFAFADANESVTVLSDSEAKSLKSE